MHSPRARARALTDSRAPPLAGPALPQLYRVSLSTAPLPLERFVANFAGEVPLPPRGIMQVQATLPAGVLTLARPPPNRLPLVDISSHSLPASPSSLPLLPLIA